MAAIAKQCFAFFLLAIVFSGQIQARDSQFFNKVPSNNADREAEIVAAADSLAAGPSAEPTFVPENENGGYGLYGHNAGQLPPAGVKRTTTPKYLPKNYNVEGYVTVPEGYRGAQPNENENGNNRFAAAEFDNNKNPNFYKSEADQNFGETSLYNNNNKVDSDDSDDSDDFNNDGIENTNFYDSQKENNFYQQNNDKENQDPNVNANYEPFNSKKNFNLYGNSGESEQPEKFASKNFNTYGDNGESQQPENFDSKKNFNLYGNNGESQQTEKFDSKKNFNLYGNSGNYYNGQNHQQNNYNGGLEGSKFADSSKYESFDANNNGGNNGVQRQGMSDTRFLENGKYFYDLNMEQQKYSRNYNRPAYRNNYNNYNQAQEQDLP